MSSHDCRRARSAGGVGRRDNAAVPPVDHGKITTICTAARGGTTVSADRSCAEMAPRCIARSFA
jgi:hypothetical protein